MIETVDGQRGVGFFDGAVEAGDDPAVRNRPL